MSTLETPLAAPADEPDDIGAELEALAVGRRRKYPRVTLTLAVALVGAGMFVGGVEAQKHLGSSSGSTSGAGAGGSAGGFSRRFGGGAGSGSAAAGAGAGITFGTVSVIRGSTLYVTDAGGNTVKVATAGARVSKTVSTTAKAISPGDTVVVQGTAQKDGTVAATSISLGGSGFGGRGFGGGNGAATGFGGGNGNNGGATGFGGAKGG
jgi:hypothetical protein